MMLTVFLVAGPQRWSVRRVLLALATSTGALPAVAVVAPNLRAGGLL